MAVSWRAWTTAGKFNSGEHSFADLPDDGVLMVVVYFNDPSGRIVRRKMSGQDYYFQLGDLLGSNNHNPRETADRYPGCVIKRGRWVADEEFRAVDKEAMEATCPP